jgi:peptidoglycan/LPS O-acetylase OafA/YrhL
VCDVTEQGGQGGYRPGLDGIRALAVAAVLWFHLDRLGGGNLGVDAFFVVSGWLITWKLLAEGDRHGIIELRRFWSARARRLMPASLAVLVAVALVWPIAGIHVASLRRDLLFAAGWASNWGTITGGGDYWAHFGDPSPIQHFWSLAIEEQFYLVWPLVLFVLVGWTWRHRLWTGVTSLSLAAASIVLMNVLFDPADPTATYMNTFARAHSLLLGAAAAAATRVLDDGSLRHGRLARRLAPVGAAIAIGIVVRVSATGDAIGADTAWLYRWGFPLFAAAMLPVVVAAADGAALRILAARPMRWVSDRSYGLYLWHWPVFLLLSPARLGVGDGFWPRLGVDAVRVAVAVVMADTSLRWLETPVRRRRRLLAWRGPAAAGVALVSLSVLAVVLVPASPATSSDAIVTLPPPPSGLVDVGPLPSTAAAAASGGATNGTTDDAADAADAADAGDAVGTGVKVASMPPVPGTAGAAGTDTDTDHAVVLGAGSGGETTPVTPAAELGRPLRVLVTGDSTGLHLAEALMDHAADVPDQLVVGSGAFPGCGLSAGTDGRLHTFTSTDGELELIDLHGCVGQWDSVPERVVTEAVDVVLVEIGPWDAVDIHLPDGSVVSVADPVGRALVRDAYQDFADRVTAAGARVLWVTPTDTHLGWGAFDAPVNESDRWVALRELVDELSEAHGVFQIDLGVWLDGTGLDPRTLRPDGVHLGEGFDERFVVEAVAPALAQLGSLIAAGG